MLHSQQGAGISVCIPAASPWAASDGTGQANRLGKLRASSLQCLLLFEFMFLFFVYMKLVKFSSLCGLPPHEVPHKKKVPVPKREQP